jgi:hypothetical protein
MHVHLALFALNLRLNARSSRQLRLNLKFAVLIVYCPLVAPALSLNLGLIFPALLKSSTDDED